MQIRFLLPITFSRPLQQGQQICSSLLTKNPFCGVLYQLIICYNDHTDFVWTSLVLL